MERRLKTLTTIHIVKGEIVKTDGNNQTKSTSTTTAGELIWKIK